MRIITLLLLLFLVHEVYGQSVGMYFEQEYTTISETMVKAELLTLERKLKKKPDNYEYLHRKATLHWILEEYEIARKMINDLYQQYPDNVAIANDVACLYLKEQKFDEAIDIYTELLKRNEKPYLPLLLNNRGLSLLGRYELTQNEADHGNSMADYKALLKVEKFKHWAYNGISMAYSSKFDYATALTYVKKAIAIKPEAFMYNNAGMYSMNLDQLNEALNYYTKALDMNPRLADAMVGKGYVLTQLGQYTEAMAMYKKATDINPRVDNVNLFRGMTYYMMEDYEAALDDLKKQPQNKNPELMAAIYFVRAEIEHKLGILDSAKVDYERSLDLNTNDTDTWASYGYLLWDIQQVDQAAEAFTKALSLNNKNFEALLYFALLEGERENYLKAIHWMAGAIELEPEMADLYFYRGLWFMEKDEQLPNAVTDFEKAIQLEVNNSLSWYNLALVHYRLDDIEQACTCMEKAMQLGDTDAKEVWESECK